MISHRFMRYSCVIVLLSACMVSGSAWAQGAPARPGKDPAIGKWKMDAKKSRFLEPGDRIMAMTRVYSVDGDKVKVWWDARRGAGKASSHTFSARCDGTLEPAYENAQIKCSYRNRSWVDGELIDDSDPAHRYYSRVVAPDGKSMKIIWFSDPERKRLKDVLQFDRVTARRSRKKIEETGPIIANNGR